MQPTRRSPSQTTPAQWLRKTKLYALALAALSLSGCAALERAQMRPTEVYYLASTPEQFAPKPPEFVIPMLSQPPQKSRSIGVFQFKTDLGRNFAIKSAAYNGRRVGADAVWIRNIHEWAEPYAYDIPGHWETRWETYYQKRMVRQRGNPGEPDKVYEENRPITVSRQEWVFPQHVSGFNHYTAIDAQMYRLR